MRIRCALLTLIVFAGAPAVRAEITEVSVQKSVLEVPQGPNASTARGFESSLELGFSSWLPSNLGSSEIPNLFLDFAPRGVQLQNGFGFKCGLGWLSLNKKSSVTLEGTNRELNQSSHLISARVGVEYSPRRSATRFFSPYVGMNVLPSALVEVQSGMGEGATRLGMMGEGVLGSRIELSAISSFNAELDVCATEKFGKIGESLMNGFGFAGGLRVAL